jgi:hypothetical protein
MSNKNIDLDKLISCVKPASERELKNCAQEIRKKMKQLKYSKYIEMDKIEVGNIIRFVELSGEKVLLPGIITNIIYEDDMIKYFIVHNNFKNIFWKINPKKYYAFMMIKNYNELMNLFKIKNI